MRRLLGYEIPSRHVARQINQNDQNAFGKNNHPLVAGKFPRAKAAPTANDGDGLGLIAGQSLPAEIEFREAAPVFSLQRSSKLFHLVDSH
jgi:hypothetical protein